MHFPSSYSSSPLNFPLSELFAQLNGKIFSFLFCRQRQSVWERNNYFWLCNEKKNVKNFHTCWLLSLSFSLSLTFFLSLPTNFHDDDDDDVDLYWSSQILTATREREKQLTKHFCGKLFFHHQKSSSSSLATSSRERKFSTFFS